MKIEILKEWKKNIKKLKRIKNLVPMEKTINQARTLENLHMFIKIMDKILIYQMKQLN